MKKTITILLTLCLSAFGFGQNVNIPDANFKAYLVGNPAINTDNDDEISVAEAEAFSGKIEIASKNISDLTGIEAFINLTYLDCNKCGNISTLDLSNNTKLTELYCHLNQLTSLDLSNNKKLTYLDCSANKIDELDVSGFTELTTLWCDRNGLTDLNVKGDTSLTRLGCWDNQLSSLDVSTLKKLSGIWVTGNPLLSQICVSPSQNTSNWQKDASAEWSTNCEPLAFSKTQSTEKPQVLKAYNPQGQEVPLNTKGEVIILLYDNGVREKTYVTE